MFILSLICHKTFNRVNVVSQLFLLLRTDLDFTIFEVDKMNHPNGSWNLNPMASYPLNKELNSVSHWNVPPYDDQFGYPHVAGRRFKNGAIFQTRQLPSDDTI